MKTEPAVTVGTIGAAVAALIALLVSFGLNISDDQQTAILGAVAVFAPLIVGVWTRSKVTPAVTASPRRGFVGD